MVNRSPGLAYALLCSPDREEENPIGGNMASRNILSISRHGLPMVGVAEIDDFLTGAETAGAVPVLLFAGDPVRWPEATDVAVVLPELIEAFQGRLQGAVIATQAELALAPRFNV